MIRLMVIALLSMVLVVPASAQAVAIIETQQTPGSHNADARITVSFQRTPLDAAVRIIAQQSGIPVMFVPNLLPAERVTYRGSGVTAEVALGAVLRGTGFRVDRTANGSLKLVAPARGKQTRNQSVITGKVTDVKTGKGVAGANVSVGNERGVTTSEDGSYRLTGIATGTHTITVRLVGYAKQTRSVTIGEGATVTVDFKLEQTANVLDQVVVTGTVVATELKAVPNAITVVTAKHIEERGITRLDQLFRGDVPGVFALNISSASMNDEVTMFSRGATALSGGASAGTRDGTNPIKTYVDGVELADPKYLSHIDPRSIERIEILTGPQASTIYGSNAINGVMQIFTKRGSTARPQVMLNFQSGWIQNNFSSAVTPQHDYSAQVSGMEGRLSYHAGGTWVYMGPWSPSKQTTTLGGFGGAQLELPTRFGPVTADVSLRRTGLTNKQRGGTTQTVTGYRETGWYQVLGFGQSSSNVTTVTDQTLGLTLRYAPTSWWSHELGFGQDASDYETLSAASFNTVEDTTGTLLRDHADKRSLRYTTTAQLPITSLAQATVTVGADSWQNLESSLTVTESNTLTGGLSGTSNVSRQPGHNAGGFLQAQLGVRDQLFLTYGLRAEWNPHFGDEVQPNYAPRYGVAYSQTIGAVTAKLRGSYGRSTRPPAAGLKNSKRALEGGFGSEVLADYGNFEYVLENQDLRPEHQKGGEGGVDLYFGTRGSLSVTRYNQLIEGLIDGPGVDSVRSLTNTPTSFIFDSEDADGFRYIRQVVFVNVGSIRNQGWELQGSLTTGPLTTRGTYSWTKSRVAEVNPQYRSYFTPERFPQYQPGATFKFVPEHTWALGTTYTRAQTTVALGVTGSGRALTNFDDRRMNDLSSNIRLLQNRLHMRNATGYITSNPGYALADLTASHRFLPSVEGVLHVTNLTNEYKRDLNGQFATIGRQTKAGIRIRL